MQKAKIVLADDHQIFRTGLKSLIDKEPSLQVVGEAGDGEALLAKLGVVRCDLVVLDLTMPNMDGVQALKIIREKFPKIRILVLTMQKDPEHFRHAMKFGASGYMLKEDAFDQLLMAIKMILKDKQFVSPAISMLMTERYIRSLDDSEAPSVEILTRRELQVLRLVAAGHANKNIAEKLKISPRTVETHRANLTNKLGIKTASRLVKYAIQKGLV